MAYVQFDEVEINNIKCLGHRVGLELLIRDDDKARIEKLQHLSEINDALSRDLDKVHKLSMGFQTYTPAGKQYIDRAAQIIREGIYEKKGFLVDHIFYDDIATVVFWKDGTKTIVKCPEGTPYDEYTAFCMAVVKKFYGTNSAIKRVIKTKARYSKKRQFLKESLGEHYVRNGEAFMEGPKHD